jgi:hypothetical protein
MANIIFDLDGTVICSKHRQLSDANGSLDLAHWRENCTPEKIAGDTLLPLARVMQTYYAEGHTIIVCTARVVTEHDFAFLEKHNLRFHHFISRHETDARGDAEYKRERLNEWARANGGNVIGDFHCIMFDDNFSVIQELIRNRVQVFDAESYNRNLARGKKMPSRLLFEMVA